MKTCVLENLKSFVLLYVTIRFDKRECVFDSDDLILMGCFLFVDLK